MAAEPTQPSELEIQEGMWIEIIECMETMYARLAAAQTEMEQKNEELLRTNELVRNVLRSMINGMLVADRDGRITIVNEAAAEILGLDVEELVGRPLSQLFAPGIPNGLFPGSPCWDTLSETGAMVDVETEILNGDGRPIPVSVNASIIRNREGDMDGALLVASDLRPLQRALSRARAEAEETERAYRELKAMQAMLVQAEKMSSLGRMAAGVAHEINNPLGAILVYSHLLLEETPAATRHHDLLEKIIRETTRCKDIVQELLGFSRAEHGRRSVVDLSRVVRAAVDLARPQPLFTDVTRALELAARPLPVEVEQGLMQQAFMDILVNAAEAMDGKGRVEIRTWGDDQRRTAFVSFTDSGPGIPEEHLSQLFEPFFTTKEGGQGTGLGLSIAFHIVQQHGGTIEVCSRPGEGAVFTVSIPLHGDGEARP